MPAQLNPLPPRLPGVLKGIDNAYRFLAGAHTSVTGLFDALNTLSTARRSANPSQRGRMKRDEEDVVRSAIVFAASGVDAAMTRLVTDAGPLLISVDSSSARKGYIQFLKNSLPSAHVESLLRDTIVGDAPSAAMLTWWVNERTAGSYLGTNDLKKRVRGALGIATTRVTDTSIDGLDDFFTARNAIVHDMDYQYKNKASSMARIRRKSEDAAKYCDDAFAVAADLINASGELIQRYGI